MPSSCYERKEGGISLTMKSSHRHAGPPSGGWGGAAICPGPQACFIVFVGGVVPKANFAQGPPEGQGGPVYKAQNNGQKITVGLQSK